MLFTSYEFIFFLLLLFALYYLLPKRWQWKLLLLASFTFYALSGLSNLVFLAVTIVTTYLASRRISAVMQQFELRKSELSREERKAYKEAQKKKARRALVLCLCVNFGLLLALKYTNFGIYNVNLLIAGFGGKTLSFVDLLLPLGISFYTFQTMGYLIDVYRGKYDIQHNIAKLALFACFFPQLIQGPISRYDELSPDLYREHGFDRTQAAFGFERILWGYFKKLVIADRIVVAVNTLIDAPETYRGVYVLLGMLFYAVRLYADFTGGIDITIGIAQVLGIRVAENFQRPYFSKSITEYWRRWHITLGTWFKEYLFYPISVAKPMLKLSHNSRKRLGDAIGKRIPVYAATIAVWFTTGFWHGASWNFIVWGLMNCVVIMCSQELIPLYERFHHAFPCIGRTTCYRAFAVLRTIFIMSSLRLFDCYDTVGEAFAQFGSLFTVWNYGELFTGGFTGFGLTVADYIVCGAATVTLFLVSMKQRRQAIRVSLLRLPVLVRYALLLTLFFSILVFGAYGQGYDSNQFIYNQF